jgi:hypothetical protein
VESRDLMFGRSALDGCIAGKKDEMSKIPLNAEELV